MEEYGSMVLDKILAQIVSKAQEQQLATKDDNLKWTKAQHRKTLEELFDTERKLKETKDTLTITEKQLNAAVDHIVHLEAAMDKTENDNKTLRENIIKASVATTPSTTNTTSSSRARGSKTDSPSHYRKQGAPSTAQASSRPRRSTGGGGRGMDKSSGASSSPKQKYHYEIGGASDSSPPPCGNLSKDSQAVSTVRSPHASAPTLAPVSNNITPVPLVATTENSKAPAGLTNSFLESSADNAATWLENQKSPDLRPLMKTAGLFLESVAATPTISNKSSDKSQDLV